MDGLICPIIRGRALVAVSAVWAIPWSFGVGTFISSEARDRLQMAGELIHRWYTAMPRVRSMVVAIQITRK